MGDIPCHDDGAIQQDTCADRILGELLAHSVDTLVKIDLNALFSFSGLAVLFWDQFGWIIIHLFEPDTIRIDFCLDVSVGRAANTEPDGARCAVARQTDHADVVSKCLATKLCPEPNAMGFC